MLKRVVMLIVLGLIFSSCDFIHYGKIAIQDNIRRIEMEREKKSVMKKDGPAAIDVDEYKEGVEEAIKDVLKRPINKKVEFKGTTLIIPEGTRINPKHGNIVDEKTGYGIAILFEIVSRFTCCAIIPDAALHKDLSIINLLQSYPTLPTELTALSIIESEL